MANLKFEMIDKFREQADKYVARMEEAQAARDTALESVRALKHQYETRIRKSVEHGEDASKELDALSDQISIAERNFQRKDLENAMVRTIGVSPIVTRDVVVQSWNEAFYPRYKEEVFDPAAKALLAAKIAYIDAHRAFRKAVGAFNAEKESVLGTLAPSGDDGKYRYKMKNIDFEFVAQTDLHYLKSSDLIDLSDGAEPRSIQYVKRSEL